MDRRAKHREDSPPGRGRDVVPVDDDVVVTSQLDDGEDSGGPLEPDDGVPMSSMTSAASDPASDSKKSLVHDPRRTTAQLTGADAKEADVAEAHAMPLSRPSSRPTLSVEPLRSSRRGIVSSLAELPPQMPLPPSQPGSRISVQPVAGASNRSLAAHVHDQHGSRSTPDLPRGIPASPAAVASPRGGGVGAHSQSSLPPSASPGSPRVASSLEPKVASAGLIPPQSVPLPQSPATPITVGPFMIPADPAQRPVAPVATKPSPAPSATSPERVCVTAGPFMFSHDAIPPPVQSAGPDVRIAMPIPAPLAAVPDARPVSPKPASPVARDVRPISPKPASPAAAADVRPASPKRAPADPPSPASPKKARSPRKNPQARSAARLAAQGSSGALDPVGLSQSVTSLPDAGALAPGALVETASPMGRPFATAPPKDLKMAIQSIQSVKSNSFRSIQRDASLIPVTLSSADSSANNTLSAIASRSSLPGITSMESMPGITTLDDDGQSQELYREGAAEMPMQEEEDGQEEVEEEEESSEYDESEQSDGGEVGEHGNGHETPLKVYQFTVIPGQPAPTTWANDEQGAAAMGSQPNISVLDSDQDLPASSSAKPSEGGRAQLKGKAKGKSKSRDLVIETVPTKSPESTPDSSTSQPTPQAQVQTPASGQVEPVKRARLVSSRKPVRPQPAPTPEIPTASSGALPSPSTPSTAVAPSPAGNQAAGAQVPLLSTSSGSAMTGSASGTVGGGLNRSRAASNRADANGQVTRLISAYNIKFRDEGDSPSASRIRSGSFTYTKGNAASTSAGAATGAATTAAPGAAAAPGASGTIGSTKRGNTMPIKGSTLRKAAGLRGEGVETAPLRDGDADGDHANKSNSIKSHFDKYGSYKSLRSLRASQNNLRRPTSLNQLRQSKEDKVGEDGGNPENQDGSVKATKRKKRRLKIENTLRTMNSFALFKHECRRVLASWRRRYESGIIRIWAGSLKFIEGRFGTGIASYFLLSRSILVTNIILATVWISTVLVVGFLGLADPFADLRGNVSTTTTMSAGIWNQMGGWTTLTSFFAGSGVWSLTPLFYSSYRPVMLQGYRMDLAYVFAILTTVVLSFIVIIRRIRSEYVRKSGFSTGIGVDDVYPFAAVVFSSWNHAVENEDIRQNQVFAVSTALRTLLTSAELAAQKANITRKQRALIYLRRVVANVASLSLLSTAGLIIFDSVRTCSSTTNTFLFNIMDVFSGNVTHADHCPTESTPTPFAPYLVSVFNAVLPTAFASLAVFEQYADPLTESRSTLARSYLIKIASIYLMLFSMGDTLLSENRDPYSCWEHTVAQRFLNLQWVDVALSSVSTFCSAFITKRIWGRFEFDMPSNILELVYRQAIIWVGSVYAPIISLQAIFTTTIMFYVKKWTIIMFADPPRRIYNSYAQVIWFLLFMLLTLLLMAVPILFAVTYITPSTHCGPYRVFPGYTLTFSAREGAYTVIPKAIESMTDIAGKSVLNLIGSIVVIGPLLAFLALCIYGLMAVSKKRNSRLNELEKEVKEEREDKKALIRYYGVQM
ncbi:Transmembrane channel-like protein 4 [Allomyces arbusculus]|nr:Transmembrane channel-like protein 4 [Allomyces arbusculus]